MLDTVAATLKASPDTKVEVQGHTDSSGSRKTNTRLSQQRADAVKNYLVSKGVKPEQLTATFRVLDDVQDPRARIRTAATWTVAPGEPSAQPA